MIKTLFFDFDGTIHNAVPIYLPETGTMILPRAKKTESQRSGARMALEAMKSIKPIM